MISNYIKLAWRNLSRQKYYTSINIIGLVSSLAFALLMSAYIWQERQVNADIRNLDNQYILQSEYKVPGIGIELTTIGALPKALKEEYPHLVADYYRFDGISCIVSRNDQVFQEEAALGDSTLLTMYGFELADGDAKTALDDPFSMAITAATAIKYFGRTDVVGETLNIRNFAGEKRDFMITAVLEDLPENSVVNLAPSMNNTVFLPMASATYFGRNVDNWQNPWIVGFIALQDGVTPEQLIEPMEQLLERHADERISENLIPVLKPLRTYHLEDNNGAVRQMILTVSLIAGFIVLMAVINFINIRISQSMSRIREVGVRKVLGSNRWQLIVQLLLESIIVVGVSAAIALAIYPILSPIFANIMGKTLPELGELPLYFYGYYAVFTLLLGVFASIYPALRLSASPILQAVKGQLTGTGEKQLVRKVLLTTQFVVAMVVLVATVAVSKQVALFFSDDLGYDKNYLITAQVPRDWTPEGLSRMETIRQELSGIPQVQNVSISYDVPSASASGMAQVATHGAAENESVSLQLIVSDAHYADTYKIPMLTGVFFAADKASARDGQTAVINKQAAIMLGFDSPEDAVGKQITINGQNPVSVAGVTDDFYLNTMHAEQPAVVWRNVFASSFYRYFSIRMQPGSMAESLTAVNNKLKELMPDAPFEYTFMDQTLERMYQSELQLKKAASAATAFSLIIVVLGIVGLVSMAVQQRVKEVGIRKVLGASATHIISLFLKDFLWVYLLALALAFPIAYYLLNQWLANYHHRMDLNVWVFGWPLVCLSALIVFFIAVQGLRAALANPVDSLRDE